ncbi:hypothetical protein [Streptomyces sp. NPDC053048]|uniref:hypothetical protein n=1 Tax=Streptomyces sp. NPDC053048 TaxID=3365694 RepID=UPI0037CFA6A2
MDRGTSDPAVPRQRPGVPGRVPLAMVVVGPTGAVTHWSSGARRLFGRTPQEAVGAPAADLLPMGGALSDYGDGVGGEAEYIPPMVGFARSGRARSARDVPADVLWWAYPLSGPGPARLLVLATDATRLPRSARERVLPAFAPHTDSPCTERLAGRLPALLPGLGRAQSRRIVARVAELGYPVLEISGHARVSGALPPA